MNVPVVSRLMPEVSMDSLVGKQLPDSSGTFTSTRSFGDPWRERKCQQPGNQLDFSFWWQAPGWVHSDNSGPEANRWHGMSLFLTLMHTPTSIALQSLPELQPIMQQQPSQPNMSILRLGPYSHFCTVCHWNFWCVECSGHWVDPRNWQTYNSCHGWSTFFNVFPLPSSRQMQSLLWARSNLSESHIQP